MLATTINLTLHGELYSSFPLEAFYHLQNFFKGSIPLDVELKCGSGKMAIIPSGVKSKLGGSK